MGRDIEADDKTALVFEPHDDDLVIGMGGTALQLLENGWDLESIQMTDGRYGDQGSLGFSEEQTVDVRKREKELEKEFLGINVRYLDLEDKHVNELYSEKDLRAEVNRKLEDITNNVRPEAVFFPRRDEDHPDHRGTYKFAQDAVDQSVADPLEFSYEVWQVPFQKKDPGELSSRIAVDVDDVYDQKIDGIKIHQSQDYPNREDYISVEDLEETSAANISEELQEHHGIFSEFADGRDRSYASRIGLITNKNYSRVELLGSKEGYEEIKDVLPDSMDYIEFGDFTHGSSGV